jgi:hypothetical protein
MGIKQTGDNMDQFHEDLNFVNEFCQSSADSLYRCAVMVHGTIQQNTENLDRITTQYDTQGFIDGDTLEWRMPYIQHFGENRHYYYNSMMTILRSKKNVADRILKLFLEADGLGLPKANFLALLATGNKSFSCLDSNLLKWYGLDPKITDYNKKLKSEESKANKRKQYLDVVSSMGGGRKLYKEWCIRVSDKSKKFKSGLQVSMKHRHWFTTWENQYPTL